MKRNAKDSMSVFISLILRHKPEAAGIRLDQYGWADVKELIEGVNRTGRKLDLAALEEIVRTDAKGRYSFDESRTKIRANQGHSVKVNVELEELSPPDLLYHGTATRFLGSILNKREGLKSMGRLYVHLSADRCTAEKVGARHGIPSVLAVNTKQMKEDGYVFLRSENGVWLTKNVPCRYLQIIAACDKIESDA